jgi:hypothetical protein
MRIMLEASEALARSEAHLEAGPAALDAAACEELAELARLVPGHARRICALLGQSELDAAADALLALPEKTPGRIEAFYRAVARGARKPRFVGESPRMLGFEFKRSRAQDFSRVLEQCMTLFGPKLERLELEGKLVYRFVIDPLAAARDGARLQTELRWIQPRLSKRAGTRLWINGWAFTAEGPLPRSAHGHLVQAWLRWANGERAPAANAGDRAHSA